MQAKEELEEFLVCFDIFFFTLLFLNTDYVNTAMEPGKELNVAEIFNNIIPLIILSESENNDGVNKRYIHENTHI